MVNFLPKAILFDMDDTILAYSAKTDESWQVVCDHFAGRLADVNSLITFSLRANLALGNQIKAFICMH